MIKQISIFVFLLLPANGYATELAFEGYPYKKIEIAEKTTTTFEITGNESLEYKVIIQHKGGEYYWRTRNDIQLIKKNLVSILLLPPLMVPGTFVF